MKTIIVIGGTKGVGNKIVLSCLNKGYNVVFVGLNDLKANEILEKYNNKKCKYFSIDISNVEACKEVIDYCWETYGRIDGYIHYAGITPIASLTDCTELVYDQVFGINLKSAFFCSQYIIQYMVKCGGGSIVYFGSAHMDCGQQDRAPYAITKSALNTLSTHIAHHYAKYKIRSNYLVMGWTDTEGELELRNSQGIGQDELKDMASKIIPMGRMLNVNDPVPSVMHLLSDESQMITGSIIRITGGEFI